MGIRLASSMIAACALLGCNEPESGFVWEVTATGDVDECNDPVVPYQETFEFVVDLSSPPTTTIGLKGEGAFATGRVSGAFIDYQSVVWTEEKNGSELRWQITGEAEFRTGGTTGSLDEGVDWLGTETFEIVDSFHPEIDVGCRYILLTEGVYMGEL